MDVVGLKPGELDQVAVGQDLSLPESYAGFLLVAGRRCGSLWRGTDAFYPRLIEIRSEALELASESAAPDVIDDIGVVIGMHQGYTFIYLSGPSPDPAVFYFREGETSGVRIDDSFSSYVFSSLQDL